MKEIIQYVWEMPAKDILRAFVVSVASLAAGAGILSVYLQWQGQRKWNKFKKKNGP